MTDPGASELSATSQPAALTPAALPPQPLDRLAAIDLGRGIAMLGVALVNIHAFAAVWSSVHGLDLAMNAADVVAEYAVALLFTHRSYPVLAFLFGVGLAWQWQRLPPQRRTANALRARLWALLLIGVAHGMLLWPGDVLSTYAIVGLVIVGLLRFSDDALLTAAITVYVLTTIVYTSFAVLGFMWAGPSIAVSEPAASFAQSSWYMALSMHRQEYLDRGIAQVMVPDFWAHALLGMWAGRSGALRRFFDTLTGNDASQRSRLLGVHIVGATLLIIGTVIEIIAARYGGWDVRTYHDIGVSLMTLAVLPTSIGAIWCWLTLAALWSRRTTSPSAGLYSLIVAAGRAPLTQFIGQSLVFAALFNKSAVGLHGEVGRAESVAIAVITWLLLCGFIRAWLASGHAHGPFEILWRGLTHVFSSPSGSTTRRE